MVTSLIFTFALLLGSIVPTYPIVPKPGTAGTNPLPTKPPGTAVQ